ncbi:hypothetical protein [Methanomethylophilus alvi]|uniref:hypothetical protein n=1 Tax=Methanomethylophilus alvi TaxID=1291540 RepID=UPI0037DCADD4
MKEFSKSYHVCERGCGRGELHITDPRIQRLQDPLLQQTEQFAENGLRDIIQRTSYRIRDEIRKNKDIQIPADADLRGLQGGEGNQDRRRPCGCGRTRDTPSAAFRTLLLRHPPHKDGPLQDPEEVNEAIRRM